MGTNPTGKSLELVQAPIPVEPARVVQVNIKKIN
jgi:hypothetical protein